MKKFTSLLVLGTIGCGLMVAADHPAVAVRKTDGQIVKEYKMHGSTVRSGWKETRRAPSARVVEENLVPITVVMQEGSVENIYGMDMAVVSRETGFIYGWEMGDDYEPIKDEPVMVPEGTYDVVGFFSAWPKAILVFADGIQADGAKTVILNAEDANKEIVFKPLRPDGEGMRVALSLEQGNCCLASVMFQVNGISPDAYSVFWQSSDAIAMPEDEEESPKEQLGAFMTNGTSAFTIGWSAVGLDFEYGNVCVAIEGDMESEEVLSNSIDNFQTFGVDYAPALNQYVDGKFQEPRNSMEYTLFWNGKWIFRQSFSHDSSFDWKQNYICNVPGARYEIGINPFESAMRIDWNTYGIQGPVVRPQNTDLIFDSAHPGDGLIQWLDRNVEGGDEVYTLNPAACWWQKEPVTFGGTVPFTTLLQGGGMMGYYFYGRNGELRTIDVPAASLCAKRNGKVVAESEEDFSTIWWSEENFISGEWDITISNSNLEVDGLKGTNDFTAHLNNAGELRSPAVTGLWFEDASGVRKERFADGAEGRMILYAGDFLFREEKEEGNWETKVWFDCETPETLEVEYAPYGSEDFRPLPLKRNSENDFMPGYGIYNEAALSDVETGSETGWYALRITIADDHGNSTLQTIAPAFRLENKAGLEAPETDLGVAPEYYDLTGMRVAHPHKGGIYIVRTGSKALKVVK